MRGDRGDRRPPFVRLLGKREALGKGQSVWRSPYSFGLVCKRLYGGVWRLLPLGRKLVEGRAGPRHARLTRFNPALVVAEGPFRCIKKKAPDSGLRYAPLEPQY